MKEKYEVIDVEPIIKNEIATSTATDILPTMIYLGCLTALLCAIYKQFQKDKDNIIVEESGNFVMNKLLNSIQTSNVFSEEFASFIQRIIIRTIEKNRKD